MRNGFIIRVFENMQYRTPRLVGEIDMILNTTKSVVTFYSLSLEYISERTIASIRLFVWIIQH